MQLRRNQQVKVKALLDGGFQKGSAKWESSDPEVASVEQSPDDELEALVKGLKDGDNPAVVITCRVDADQDEGETEVRELIGSLDVVVTQGDARAMTLEAGTPEDIPEETAGGE